MSAGKSIIFNFISIAYVRDSKRLQASEGENGEAFHSIIHHYFLLLHRHARQAYLLKEDCSPLCASFSSENYQQKRVLAEIVL